MPNEPLITVDPDVLERFWSKVDKSAGPEGCWLWTAGTGSHGYGVFYPAHGNQVLAHRFSLAQVHPIRLKAHALHDCDNRLCVNPAHLRWGTHAQNMFESALRGKSKPGRTLGDSCPQGHPYTPENILTSTRQGAHGKRYEVHSCRECNRQYLARRRALRKAA